MELGFSNVFLVLGFIQGIILIIVAFGHKAMNQLSRKLLGILLIILTLGTLGTFANHELEYFSHPVELRLFVNYFPYYLIMILGPTIYFHCKSVLNRDFKLKRSDKFQFYPVLLEFVPFVLSLLVLAGSALNIIGELQDGYIKYLWYYQRGMEIPRALSIIFYMILGWKYLVKQKLKTNEQGYKWAQTLLTIFSGLIFLFVIDLAIFFSPLGALVFEYKVDIYTIYYPIVAFIYFLTFRLAFQKTPWYFNSFEVPEIEMKATQILGYIEKGKIFQNPDLKLGDISKGTGIPEKAISFVLNHHFQKGFNAFINELRIKEVLERIDNGDLERFTIEGIATSTGFASRTTFYRAFKKFTSKLPSEYLSDS